MGVRDDRSAPFCWQSTGALRHLRDRWPARKPSLSLGLVVYMALTEIANEGHSRTRIGSDSDGFEATRSYIATKAGVDKRSVDAAVGELTRIGLLQVERRRVGRVHAPSVYVLKEQGGGGDSSPPSEQTAAKTDRQGVAETVRPTTEEEKGKELEEAPSPTSNEVEDVWSHCEAAFNTNRLPSNRERRAIEQALEVATVEECCRAIDAAGSSDWHRDRGFTAPSKIFRKRQQQDDSLRDRIDFWLDLRAEQAGDDDQAVEDDLDVDTVRREQGLED